MSAYHFLVADARTFLTSWGIKLHDFFIKLHDYVILLNNQGLTKMGIKRQVIDFIIYFIKLQNYVKKKCSGGKISF